MSESQSLAMEPRYPDSLRGKPGRMFLTECRLRIFQGKEQAWMKANHKPKMKTKNLLLLLALIAGLGLIPVGRVTAQTFTTLYSFTATSGPFDTNSDGANPVAGLILSDNTLYGTATDGGSSGYGTVFSLSFTPQLTII